MKALVILLALPTSISNIAASLAEQGQLSAVIPFTAAVCCSLVAGFLFAWLGWCASRWAQSDVFVHRFVGWVQGAVAGVALIGTATGAWLIYEPADWLIGGPALLAGALAWIIAAVYAKKQPPICTPSWWDVLGEQALYLAVAMVLLWGPCLMGATLHLAFGPINVIGFFQSGTGVPPIPHDIRANLLEMHWQFTGMAALLSLTNLPLIFLVTGALRWASPPSTTLNHTL